MPDRTIRYLEQNAPGVLPSGPQIPSRRHTLIDQRLDAQKIESSVDDLTITGDLAHFGGGIGEYGATPVPQGGPFTQTYATADATLSAYTPDVENVAYTGLASGLGGVPYASVADLNAARVALENLRVFCEDLAGFVNAFVDYWQSRGSVT